MTNATTPVSGLATANDTAAAASGGQPATPLSDSLVETLHEMRQTTGYLARNVDAAFDGVLDSEHANAHGSMTKLLGLFTTLDEDLSQVREMERRDRNRQAPDSGTPRVDAPAPLRALDTPSMREKLAEDAEDVADELLGFLGDLGGALDLAASPSFSLEEREHETQTALRSLACLTKTAHRLRVIAVNARYLAGGAT